MSQANQDFSLATTSALDISQRYQVVQDMVMDYALGTAIVGLNPFPQLFTPVFLATVAIIGKMLWDIGRKWRFAWRGNPLVLANTALDVIGAFTIAFLAWLTLIIIGTFWPLFTPCALAAAFMTFTLSIGRTANQFGLNGYLRRGFNQDTKDPSEPAPSGEDAIADG